MIKRFRGLAQAAAEVASPQLRNQGTIGGNLCQKPRCWYYRADFTCLRKGGGTCFAVDGENQFHCIFGGGTCFIVHPSDTAPALAAFNATARVAGPKGVRNVPLEKFFVLPEVDVQRETVLAHGEIVTEIRIPPPAPALGAATARFGRGAPGISRWPASLWRSGSTASGWSAAGSSSAGPLPCRGAARRWSRLCEARNSRPK